MRKKPIITLASLIIFSVIFALKPSSIHFYAAESSKHPVAGVKYVFSEKSKYDFTSPDSMEATTKENTYGLFKLSGEISSVSTKDGLPSYAVSEGNLQFIYSYDDTMLNATDAQEHLVDDKSKVINDITLDNDILNGALVLQTSKDGKIWYTVPNETETNIFATDKVRTEPFYTTTDTQLMNGCYYKIVIAYKTEKTVGTNKVLFVKTDNKEYHKYAEVYSFYAYNPTAEKIKVPEDDNRMNMGKLVRCTDFDSYSGGKDIDNEDPHSGWSVGSFFVGGWTDNVIDPQTENTVFLKNEGDRISLWFDLEQNINQCRNNPDIKIVADPNGYDQGFDVPGGVNETMDFGKGVLMIRQKYKDNTYSDPQVYTNFLEAGASPDATTKVDLFEEGDYEVALDYAVKYNKTKLFGKSIAPQTNHYRIAFEFEVRNGNTMVFLKDTDTGSELTNGAITENGFSIDLANSQYLKVHVKREVLKDGFDGLVEDTRFNSSATNGDKFTKEGIYTVTVSNQYNDASTELRIYVGNDNILKAHMLTGLSISEIQNQLELGAKIEDDGTLVPPPEPEPEPETEHNSGHGTGGDNTTGEISANNVSAGTIDETSADEAVGVDDSKGNNSSLAEEKDDTEDKTGKSFQLHIILVSVVVLLVFIILKKKKPSPLKSKTDSLEKEGQGEKVDEASNKKEDE